MDIQSSDTNQRLTGTNKKIMQYAWWGITLFSLVVLTILVKGLFDLYVGNPLLTYARRSFYPSSFIPQYLEDMGLSLNYVILHLEITTWLPALITILLGIYIYRMRPNDLMAIISSLFLITFGTYGVVFDQFRVVYSHLEWVEPVVFVTGWVCLMAFFLLFPNGQLVPKKPWVPIIISVLVSIPSVIVGTHQVIKFVETMQDLREQMSLPFEITGSGFVVFSQYSFLGFLAVGAGVQIFRYRHVSNLQERQQAKWLAFGVTFLVIFTRLTRGYIGTEDYILLNIENFGKFHNLNLIQAVGNFIIPVSITIAIVRYRWLNIDLVVNRSLVYGGLTVLLAGLFGGSLWLVSNLFADAPNGPVIAVAVSASAFGIIFQPTRRRLQHFVDRRFYNIQIEYDRTPAPTPDFTSFRPQGQFGEFDNLTLIGRGGMGEVYRAVRSEDGQVVALKLLPPDLAEDNRYRKRFDREATTISGLDHKNIVKIIDYGERNNVPFIAMELVDGHDLGEHLRKVRRMPLEQMVGVISDVAEALDYAHGRGLVHRDIKPSNVMLDWSGGDQRAVLMDFGVAKILEGVSLMTKSGFLGTLDYIAPEQIQASADVDHRADIYALGVMIYQMLTGELPFKSDNPGALLMAHLNQPAPDVREMVPELPREIARALQKAMAKNPEERFDSAGEMYQSLI